MGRIKNALLSTILIGACLIGAGGCKATKAVVPYEKRGPVHTGINVRGAWEIKYYNLDIESENVPVHPDDSSFLTGSTDVKARDGIDILGASLGIEGLVGSKSAFLKGGVDLTLSARSIAGADKDHTYGLYDFEQQKNDTRPKDQGSFAYDKVSPPIAGLRPFVGVGKKLGNWTIGAEMGFPFGEWRREWGHHRYDREDRIGSERCTDLGIRPAIEIIHKESDKLSVGLEAAYERHKLSFGDIEAFSLAISFKF